MEKTWKPTVAGILDIITGALGLIGVTFLIIGGFFIPVWSTNGALGIPGTQAIPFFIPSIFWGIIIFSAIIGILALVGGIYAVQRKKWGWALTGSIAAILSNLILGILATIFTAMSKDEFE